MPADCFVPRLVTENDLVSGDPSESEVVFRLIRWVLCFRRYSFCHGRIGEIRPLILLDLGWAILEGFCYSDESLMYVVNDTSLLLYRTVQRLCSLKLIAQIHIFLLQLFPKSDLVAASLADDEAESGGYQHPYW